MKDVEKTNIERANSGKRMRRRRRSMNFYAALVLIFASAAFAAMSYTFLFNIENIVVVVVSGEDSETKEEVQQKGDIVAENSGIKTGDNLLRVNTEKSAENILDNVSFVETAEVRRNFPSDLEIRVAYCVPSFNVEYSGGVLVVSKLGKILENNNFITDGLPTITGIQPVTVETGEMLSSDNEHKNEALEELMASISDDSGISGIDINDEFGIVISYTNGTLFRMGNWNDAEYKLQLAGTVMQDGSVNGKKGYLTMIGSHQCTFRTSDEPAGVIGSEAPAPTDNEGNTIAQNIGAEVNPEQEAIFSEFNSRAEEGGDASAGYTYDDQYNYNQYNGYDDNYDYGYNDYDYNYDYSYDYDNSDFNWGNDGW